MKKIYHLSALLLMFIINIGNVYSQTCPTDMVAYWKMEEVGSTVLSDYISNHDATSSSILANVLDGKVGSAKYFDGTISATVSNHTDFAFPAGGSFSVEFWVKVPAASAGTKVLVGKRDSNSSGSYWFVGLNSTGKLTFELQDSDGGVREIISSSTVVYGMWQHVVAVRDEATNGNYLYVDGSLAASSIINYTGSFISDGAVTLGCFNNSSGIPSYFFTGSLDEIAILKRALSSSEITEHKQKGDDGIGYCDGFSPSFISTPVIKATVNTLYSYTARATGLQSNMRYTLLQKPVGMNIDEISGEISWTPSSVNDDGYVEIMADNGTPPADTQSFRIFVGDAPDCPAGLTLLLRLDESSGPEYADFYGEHNATATVSPTATGGIIAGGQTFGPTTGLDIPDNGTEFDWSYIDNWSIEFWMKTSNTGTQVIAGRYRDDDYEDRAKWWVGIGETGLATFFLQDNSASYINFEISGGPYLPDNQWHHIIAVRMGSSQQMFLYVDGLEAASVNTNFTNSFKADLPTPVSVGYYRRKNPGDNEYHYSGILDEFAIFNRGIQASDASTYYNMGEPTGHCTPGNYAPIILSNPVTEAIQDQVYSYTFEVDEADEGDVLTLSAPVKPDWLTFTFIPGQKTAVLSGTPGNDDVTTAASVTLRVTDGTAIVDQSFVINVANVNDLPEITSIPADTVNEDTYYSYTLTVEDIDPDDVITMTPVAKPDWMTFTWNPGDRTAILDGTPTDAYTGDNSINISVSDGTATIAEIYTLYVVPINDVPVITGQNPLSVKEDNSIGLKVTDLVIVDEDNTTSQLTLNVMAGNKYTVTGNVVRPEENFFGTISVPVTVSDLESESDAYNVIITVESVNDVPMIVSQPDLDIEVDHLYAYSIEAEDADGDNLTYAAEVLPGFLTFYPSNALIAGTPHGEDFGEHLVIVTVTDGILKVEQSFVLNVTWPAGIEDQAAQAMKLYPSPASHMLYLEFDVLQEDAVASIYNSGGKLVKSIEVAAGSDKTSFEVSDLSNGSYFCVLRNNQTEHAVKFLINK